MQHRVKARDLKELITGLIEAGQIVVREGEAAVRGPKPRFYRVA
jgi:hypothetical protein